jgi:hypothetical protein
MLAGMAAILDALAATGSSTAKSPDRPWVAPNYVSGARVTFKLIALAGNGVDEERRTYNPATAIPGDTYVDPVTGLPIGGLDVEVCGQRVLTLSVRVECDNNAVTAFPFAENIRAGLKRASVLSSMQDLGLSIARIGAARDLSFTGKDARTVSVAQFDLALNGASNITDTAVTTIETVELSRET